MWREGSHQQRVCDPLLISSFHSGNFAPQIIPMEGAFGYKK